VYIKREIEGEIINYLSKREIIAVIGPRQSGKTTMIKQILMQSKSNLKLFCEDKEFGGTDTEKFWLYG